MAKFFPAGQVGGIATLDELPRPLPTMPSPPNGGVTVDTMVPCLGRPNVLAVGGSWMVSQALVAAQGLAAIARAAQAVVHRARTVDVGPPGWSVRRNAAAPWADPQPRPRG